MARDLESTGWEVIHFLLQSVMYPLLPLASHFVHLETQIETGMLYNIAVMLCIKSHQVAQKSLYTYHCPLITTC